jgi:hypothetical protein
VEERGIKMKIHKATLRNLGLWAFILAAVGLLFSQDKIQGTWAALAREDNIHIKLTVFSEEAYSFGDWSVSTTLKKGDLAGLQMNDQEHSFTLTREAGTIVFHGRFSGKRGVGDFDFTPDSGFLGFLSKEGSDGVTGQKALTLCLHDIGRKYIQDMKKSGLEGITLSKIISFAVHGIDLAYINTIRSLGFPDISASKVISFKVHDIDKKYIQEMKKIFPDLSSSHLISFAVHSISADYINDMWTLSPEELSPSRIISFKVHDIDRPYVESLRGLFREELSGSKVISFAVHGITPQYVKEIKGLGFEDITPSQIISFKVHDIDAEYIKSLKELAKGKELTASKVIRFKVAGI